MLPELAYFRSEAKRLKKACKNADAAALQRLTPYIDVSKPPKHADFLHVIARENHFPSWPKLKLATQLDRLSKNERAETLKRALFYGQSWVVGRLLTEDSSLGHANLGVAIALYDEAFVSNVIHNRPSAATELIGIRSPLLHLCFSQYIHQSPESEQAMLNIASLLKNNGAEVNDSYPAEPGSEHRLSALYGALGHANNMVLAEWLLAHGADPNDDESLYHATELGHHRGLQLLLNYGARPNGTNALGRALDFNDLPAVKLLLEHGADPNEAVNEHPSGQPVDTVPALHQAARRGCSADIGRLLLAYGADPKSHWLGHSPYGIASVFGNTEFADMLWQEGFATELSPEEQILSGCALGEMPSDSITTDQLGPEDRLLLTRMAAVPSSTAILKALVAVGLDPDTTDEMGLTPLHVAAWEGVPEHLEYLLTLNPDLTYRNHYGGDAMGTLIHGAEFCPHRGQRDYAQCANLLLEAGAPLDAEEVDACGVEQLVPLLEGWLAKHQ